MLFMLIGQALYYIILHPHVVISNIVIIWVYYWNELKILSLRKHEPFFKSMIDYESISMI